MERSVSLRVLGPAFYRAAVEQRLAASVHAVIAEHPQVVLLLGELWLAELEKLRDELSLADPMGIILVVDQRVDLRQAAQRGIRVFLDENGGEGELQQALAAAASRNGYCSPGLIGGLLRHLGSEPQTAAPTHDRKDRLAALSEREREVAQLVAQGWKNERVAAHLYLSLATVKFHLSRIYTKLGIECRAELAACLSQVGATTDSALH